MKKLAIILGLMLILPCMAHAWSLAWDVPLGTIDGYRIYMGTTPDNQTAIADVPVAQLADQTAPSWPLATLPALGELFYYSVTAYNQAGESERSNTVEYSFEVHGIPQWLEEQGLRIVQNAGNINVTVNKPRSVDVNAKWMHVDVKGEKVSMRIK